MLVSYIYICIEVNFNFPGIQIRSFSIMLSKVSFCVLQLLCPELLNSIYSGEKTSTKEWPTSLEIKGRVRLDAFEKFLQDLPMSRTRAVMVYQGPLLFLVTNCCLLFSWPLAFSLQRRQCGLPLRMVNGINLCLVLLVWMYNSSADEKYTKKLIWLDQCFGTYIPIFLAENYVMKFVKKIKNK